MKLALIVGEDIAAKVEPSHHLGHLFCLLLFFLVENGSCFLGLHADIEKLLFNVVQLGCELGVGLAEAVHGDSSLFALVRHLLQLHPELIDIGVQFVVVLARTCRVLLEPSQFVPSLTQTSFDCRNVRFPLRDLILKLILPSQELIPFILFEHKTRGARTVSHPRVGAWCLSARDFL